MRWVGCVASIGEMKCVYKTFVRKCERKRPLRKPRHRWEHNIRMDLKELDWEGVDSGGLL
jgi:hypothetical protein